MAGGLTVGLLLDPLYKAHDTGPGHPETAGRYDAVTAALEGVRKQMAPVKPRAADEDEIALCHSRTYLATARRDIANKRGQLSTGDTSISAASWDVATQAAGGVLNAAHAVAQGELKRAFCAVRPPGHHATPDRGMGFCVINNVAVAARWLQKKHGVGRVLIVDWDVHHGNGTQDIFYRDGSVLFLSTHQHPWYPGTGMADERGEGKGEGRILNFPLAAGAGRAEILPVFQQTLMRAAEEFKPEFVLISAGFDSRAGDPLGKFRLTDEDFADLTAVLREIGEKHAGGRVLSVLEGGYSLPGLAAGVRAHVDALLA